jgi:Homeodomain-like domain
MRGESPVSAREDQRAALMALAGSRDRGEADRERAILLTLSGWTSPRIAEAFSVRKDTVQLWRRDFSRRGTDALKVSVAPGPSPVKSKTALRVVRRRLQRPPRRRPQGDRETGEHAAVPNTVRPFWSGVAQRQP